MNSFKTIYNAALEEKLEKTGLHIPEPTQDMSQDKPRPKHFKSQVPMIDGEPVPILKELVVPMNNIPMNRESERGARAELRRICELVWPIERDMYQVALDPEGAEYDIAYKQTLERFAHAIKIIEKQVKPKYWRVWKLYIEEIFNLTEIGICPCDASFNPSPPLQGQHD